MVLFASFVGAAALLSGFANGLPRPDSAIGQEVAVSAPNGIIMSDTAELYSQLVTAADSQSSTSAAPYASATAPPSNGYGSGSYGSSPPSYGSNNYNDGQYQGGAQYSSQPWSSSSTITYAPPAYTSASTSSAWQTYSTPTYGSGGSDWGNNQQYNDCVQQCLASYTGLPAATYTPTATNIPAYGTGATHTVIVAPTQGVLRYIPFAVNASVGDTIKFMWGANNHTVTKSSALLPCNKSSDALFTSGTQNQGFVFTQVVNDTNPTFFYCGTPTHCQKGMFGIINPPSALGVSTSVGQMMPGLAANNSDVAAYSAYTAQQTVTNPEAAKWGNSIDMSSMPDWSQQYVAENVMYTRTFLSANPEVLQEDGSINLATSGSTPLMIPQDLSAAIANSGTTPAASSAPTVVATSQAPAATSGTPENATNSATSSVASPRTLTALALAVAGFLML